MQDRHKSASIDPGRMRDRASAAFDLDTWRDKLIQYVLRVMVIVVVFPVLIASYYRFTQQRFGAILIFWLMYGVILFLTFMRRLKYSLRVYVVICLLFSLAIVDFSVDGRAGASRILLLSATFAAAIFLGERLGLYALLVSLVLEGVFAYLFLSGFLSAPTPVSSVDFNGWVSSIFVLAMLGTFVVASVNYLVPRLIETMTQSSRLARELSGSQTRLEALVVQQQHDLGRRGTQLAAAARVAREATQFQELNQILSGTVGLISEYFGVYHAGIFLVDKERKYVELRGASSDGGLAMLARKYRQEMDVGIVGHVMQSGEAHVSLDVDEDAEFISVADLPDTRSEIVLPLRTREGVIGVLDVQSLDAQAFDEEATVILQALADQIALVIHNAQLLQQVEQQVEAERQFYQQLSGRAWKELIASAAVSGFVRSSKGIFPAEDIWRPRMDQAVDSGKLIFDEQDRTAVSVPIRVRGQIIGVIDARKPGGGGAWTQEELDLLTTLSAQLDPALDSAQLYQNSQLLAKQEQVTREISSRMRETLDVDMVLRTAAREIGDVLRLSDFVIRIGTADQLLAQETFVDMDTHPDTDDNAEGGA